MSHPRSWGRHSSFERSKDIHLLRHWFGPLGCLWRPACHTILDGVGVVVFRVNLVKNVIEGVYNTISVVTFIVYINVKMIKYIPLYIMWL